MTRPVTTRPFGFFCSTSPIVTLLPEHRFHPRDVATQPFDEVRLPQLAARRLHAHVELFFAQPQEFRLELRRRFVSDLGRFHHITERLTNVVLNGSFAAANANA